MQVHDERLVELCRMYRQLACKENQATDRDGLRKHPNIEELSPSSFAILLVDPVCRCEGGRSTWMVRRQRYAATK